MPCPFTIPTIPKRYAIPIILFLVLLNLLPRAPLPCTSPYVSTQLLQAPPILLDPHSLRGESCPPCAACSPCDACPPPCAGGGDSGGGDSGNLKALVQLLDLDNPTFLGVTAMPFGWTEQMVFYRLLRHLYASKMYPMDVLDLPGPKKQPVIPQFHQFPKWGERRGYPLTRHYINTWMKQFRDQHYFGEMRTLAARNALRVAHTASREAQITSRAAQNVSRAAHSR